MTAAPRCLYKVHIADGFVDDCDELMHRCSKLETLTFAAFCEIWKDLNFANIYKGRTLSAEIAELTEETIHIAKQYLVANTSNFEESVAGLFLIYGLLNLQPFKGFAVLRLVPDDMPAIHRIEFVARRERRMEVLYILGSVLIRGPCQFHATPREHGIESSYRKYVEGCTSLDKQGIRPKGVFYRQNEELDIIRELNSLTRLYADAKSKIFEGKEMDRNLNYVDKGLPAELDSSLKMIINGLIDDEPYDSDQEENATSSHNVHNTVQEIKSRAMATAVNPINHLTGVQERKGKDNSSKHKSETTSKSSKVKGLSPRRPPLPESLKRNSISKNIAKSKKRKKNEDVSSSDSEVDYSEDAAVPTESADESDSDPIILNPPNNIEIVNNDLMQIEVDLIPVVIHKDKSQMIEIEIFDHYANRTVNEEEPASAQSKIMQLPEVTLVKNGESSIMPAQHTTSAADNDFKKPQPIEKPDKREQKKTHLKSKLKRMGILPVANFKDGKTRSSSKKKNNNL